MQYAKYAVLLGILFEFYDVALTVSRDIPDYEYESDLPVHVYHGDDEIRNAESVWSEMAEDEPETFNEKEKRIRIALLRSSQDVRNRRTLSEVVPILRSIPKQQRLLLAALIAKQTNARSGSELNLHQVRKYFQYFTNTQMLTMFVVFCFQILFIHTIFAF